MGLHGVLSVACNRTVGQQLQLAALLLSPLPVATEQPHHLQQVTGFSMAAYNAIVVAFSSAVRQPVNSTRGPYPFDLQLYVLQVK